MSNFPTIARVVFIGGGTIGVSTLFHLARRWAWPGLIWPYPEPS